MLKMKVNESDNHFMKEIVTSLFRTMLYDISNIIYKLSKISDKKMSRADIIFNEFIRLIETHSHTEKGILVCTTDVYHTEISF